ncbi:thiamine-phosphate kinase [Caulobacter sp. S45]|uniref:thiamine-phosphate kinase n=1 Tax=Caulobacter sp. S45 TaxID=1641861 RepID=UPI00157538BA|nr:thiamine-phosphate kinase [Caulobacter sp. S45]
MSASGPPEMGEPDEFEQIARLYRPLTQGSPEALGLLDDVAVLPSRPGFDLVITTDAMVAGVHFLPDEALDLVSRKLLRANLSDLAAKAAEPHGYLLTVAWPLNIGFKARSQFAAGLAQDQVSFGVRLLGGDTVSTSGPLTASMTLLGWTPAGHVVRRDGAQVGDVVVVSGTIGDACLGLQVLTGGLAELTRAQREELQDRHRLPMPRLALQDALRRYASAAADVSDGLLADACHIGEASGLGVSIRLDRLPLSAPARAWLASQPDPSAARLALATGGDDYEVVCAIPPGYVDAFTEAAALSGTTVTAVGEVCQGAGLSASFRGHAVAVGRRGWSHA